MKITKNSVILDTENMVHGCLEQGGVCGKKERYDLAAVMAATEMTADELADAGEDDLCECYDHLTIREVIEHHCTPVTIRRGHIIQ